MNVPKKLKKYLTVSRITYSNQTAYLYNILGQMVLILFRVWIFTQLYSVTFKATGESVVNGLGVAMVIWTIALTQAFSSSVQGIATYEIKEEVIDGTIVYSFNRPYNFGLFYYFSMWAWFVSRLTVNLLAAILFTLALVGPITLSLFGVLSGLILLICGVTLGFLMDFCIGLTALWLEDISAIKWIVSKAQMIFGGAIIPIALFPDHYRQLVQLTPFSQTYYSSAISIVNFQLGFFLQSLLVQIYWISFFGALAYLIYSRGLRHLSINGG